MGECRSCIVLYLNIPLSEQYHFSVPPAHTYTSAYSFRFHSRSMLLQKWEISSARAREYVHSGLYLHAALALDRLNHYLQHLISLMSDRDETTNLRTMASPIFLMLSSSVPL